MTEYIEKQQAIDVAREDGKKIPTLAIRIMHDIKAIPAADVVPVVRCKDCVYCDKATYDCHNDRWGNGHAYYPPPVVREDGFCMDGKRKE